MAGIVIRTHVADIDWYCERHGSGPSVVLVPSGEGDCGSFAATAALLAQRFTVLTFDTPGFSRSSDPPGFDQYTAAQAATEIASLVSALDMAPAVFYGCSSGGVFTLSLVADHPDVVREAVVHEVPMPGEAPQIDPSMGDAEIVAACRTAFRDVSNEDPDAWGALGPEYHERLTPNYVTWVRHYIGNSILREFSSEELRRRPVTWTIGSRWPPPGAEVFFGSNAPLARSAGIEVGRLPSRHFPQVPIPEVLAEHIAAVAARPTDR